MADPISVAANAAALVGLADLALKASKELYNFFNDLRDAPTEIKHLETELEEVSRLLSDIRIFSLDFRSSPFASKDGRGLESLLSALKSCEQDITSMRESLQPIENHRNSRTKIKSVASRVQWVFMKDKIERFQQQLGRHKITLLTSLSLRGRWNEISLRDCAEVAPQEFADLRVLATEHYQGLNGSLNETKTQLARISETTLQAMQNMITASYDDSKIIKDSSTATTISIGKLARYLRQDNVEMRRELQAIRHMVKTSRLNACAESCQTNHGASSEMKNLRRGIRYNQRKQKRFIQTRESLQANSSRNPDPPLACMSSFNLAGNEQLEWRSLLEQIGIACITLPLLLMRDPLQTVLFSQASYGGLTSDWIWSEYNRLLAASHEFSALLSSNVSKVSLRYSSLSFRGNGTVQLPAERTLSHRDNKILHGEFCRSKRYDKRLVTSSPAGIFSLEIDHPVVLDAQKNDAARISFIPTKDTCRVGLVAEFARSFWAGGHPSISRHLYIVNTISEEMKADVIDVVKTNNVRGLQRMISAGTLTPFDCLNNGRTSLLTLASNVGAVEIVETLLQQGADARYCYRDESILWSIWVHYIFTSRLDTSRSRRMSEIAIQYGALEEDCRDFAHSGLEYGSLLHLLGHYVKELRDDSVLDYLMEIGCQIDARNSLGETPFLYAIRRYEPYTRQFCVALLTRKASSKAIDHRGRGALHIALFYYIDFVINNMRDWHEDEWNLMKTSGFLGLLITYNNDKHAPRLDKESVISFQHIEQVFEREHSALYELLIFLLQAGCDTALTDNEGRLPSDYAAQHVILWNHWSLAVQRFTELTSGS